MYCENCGKQIKDDSKFCQYCGGKTDATEILIETAERAKTTVMAGEAVEGIMAGAGKTIADTTFVMLEVRETNKQNKIKKGVIGAVAAVIVAALAVLIGISIYNRPENRLARALDLGQRYLLEENYEQAIVEFNRAIEIDPKNEEAYIGLAEAYAETDDLEKAVRTLEKGTNKTDSDELREMLEKYMEKLAEEEVSDSMAAVREENLPETDRMPEADMPDAELPETEAPANESSAYGSWSGAYENFVIGHIFLNEVDIDSGYGDNSYTEYSTVSFALHDMDRDGVPELFIYNGFNGRDQRASYIFSYDGTQIRYCGNVQPECYWVSDYPGVFYKVYMSGFFMEPEYADKYSDVTYLYHAMVEEYSVVKDTVAIVGRTFDGNGDILIDSTNDTELYRASQQTQYGSLQYMTLAEIEEQGWETFLRTLFE